MPAIRAYIYGSRSTSSTTEQGAIDEPRESLTHFFGRQTETGARGGSGAPAPGTRRPPPARLAERIGQSLLRRRPRQEGRLRHPGRRGSIAWTGLRGGAGGWDGIIAELNPGAGASRFEAGERGGLRLLTHEV